ncbi:MAG: hypothetical protein GXP43_00985 [bacterium]|nr:hypothetical protein [bacterium]
MKKEQDFSGFVSLGLLLITIAVVAAVSYGLIKLVGVLFGFNFPQAESIK